MQIATSQLRANDLIRGIGIVVGAAAYNEETNETLVHGHTVDRETGAMFTTSVLLPGPHRVNVRREFQVGDIVTVANPEFAASYDEDEDDYAEEQFLRVEVVEVLPSERAVRVANPDAAEDTLTVDFRQARHAA